MELRNNWYKADKGKHFVLTEKGKEECDYIKRPNGDYVDGSFRLSTEDVDEMEAIVDF